jgi:predicted RNA-binding protein with PUA-like domain
MKHFLLKTEPNAYSIDDLKREVTTSWGGVRNYQARNIMRTMALGDLCFMYHSSCEVPAIMGVAEVVKIAYPDPLQFDQKSEYFDPDSPIMEPRWDAVDVCYVRHMDRPITLSEMRFSPTLAGLRLLDKGNRLSVMDIEESFVDDILALE